MERYDKVKRNLKEIFINNVIGGVAWALGATIGFSLIIAFLTLISKQIDLIPVIGNFASQVTHYVLQSNPQWVK